MMKGNEKDCICANNGKHTKNCDAYRLSQFLGQAAVIALDQPDSPGEKKCTVCLGNHADGSCRICYHSEHKSLKECKRCGEPETAHEKDFIESAISEFRDGTLWHGIKSDSNQMHVIKTFLKEKLVEAMEYERNTPMTIEQYQYVHKICEERRDKMREVHEQQLQEEFRQGRLAMKEEILSELVQMQDSVTIPEPMKLHDRTYEGNLYLATLKTVWAAIRNKK